MKREDIEKFVRENDNLARYIAYFNCGNTCCSECIFHVELEETICLSSELEAIIRANDSYKHNSEDNNAKETRNN